MENYQNCTTVVRNDIHTHVTVSSS